MVESNLTSQCNALLQWLESQTYSLTKMSKFDTTMSSHLIRYYITLAFTKSYLFGTKYAETKFDTDQIGWEVDVWRGVGTQGKGAKRGTE